MGADGSARLRVPIHRAFFCTNPSAALSHTLRCSGRPEGCEYFTQASQSSSILFNGRLQEQSFDWRQAAGKFGRLVFVFPPTSMRCAILRNCIFEVSERQFVPYSTVVRLVVV